MGMKSVAVGKLLPFLLMAEGLDKSFLMDGDERKPIRLEDIDGRVKVSKPPVGCKEYFFNKNGSFSTGSMRKDETVFYCHAINDKSAKRKFNKWYENNKGV